MKAFKPWPDRIVRQNTCMNTRACAVLVPIIYKDGEEQAVFEVRSSKLGWQPGDVCFPGGRIDDGDDSALEAALRGDEGGTRRRPIPYPRLGPPGLHGITCRRHRMALCRLYGYR